MWLGRWEACCENCDESIDSVWTFWVHKSVGKECGVLYHTCHGCLSHYCSRCDEDEDQIFLNFCHSCEHFYCTECSKIDVCDSCDKYFCHDCTSFFTGCAGDRCEENYFCGDCQVKCDLCNQISCKDCRTVRYSDEYTENGCACLNDCTGCNRTMCAHCMRSSSPCDMCETEVCGDCSDDEADGVLYCGECDAELCFCCRFRNFKKNGSKCSECFGIIGSAFDHVKGLHENVAQTRNSNDDGSLSDSRNHALHHPV
jgi:hypothetical protein